MIKILLLAILVSVEFSASSQLEFSKKRELDHFDDVDRFGALNLNQNKFWENIVNSKKSKRESRHFLKDISPSNQFLRETKLCESRISFKRPQRLKNVNNKWRTIINHSNYTQFVRFEDCLSRNFPCTYNIYPRPVRSFCEQNYHQISLYAMDDEENCLIMDKFMIPSSCDCMIEKEDFFQGVSKDLLDKRP
jgi:Spaetzle